MSRPRTRVVAPPEAALGDLGPQWPSVASEQHAAVPETPATQGRRAQPSSSAADGDITGSVRRSTPDAPPPDAADQDGSAWPGVAAARRAVSSVFSSGPAGRTQPSAVAADPDTTGSLGSAPITKAPPAAAWPAYVVPAPVRAFTVEVGGRYWYSSGKADFGFRNGTPGYGDPTSTLDWRGNEGHAGEVFGRIDHRPTGIFVKGLIGAGSLSGGTITDRDFFTGQYEFSDTTSRITGDSLRYGIVDAGWSYNVPGARFRVGGFVGYHYWSETLGASGLVTNPDDFGGAYWGVPPGTKLVPDSTAVFVYEPTWHALRLGIDGRWEFMPGWSVAGEAAYVPIASLENKDSHLLRQDMSDLGPAPNIVSRSSRGWGVEAEVFLNYAVTSYLELGVGGRWWGLNADKGTVAFGPSFGATYDLTKFEQQRYGLLLQAKGRF